MPGTLCPSVSLGSSVRNIEPFLSTQATETLLLPFHPGRGSHSPLGLLFQWESRTDALTVWGASQACWSLVENDTPPTQDSKLIEQLPNPGPLSLPCYAILGRFPGKIPRLSALQMGSSFQRSTFCIPVKTVLQHCHFCC